MINDNFDSFEIYNSSKKNSQQPQINNFRLNEIKFDYILEEIQNLLSNPLFNQGIKIILFYEYFFGRKPILYNNKKQIISQIINVSKNLDNTLFFAPIFYQLEKEPSDEYINNIIEYNNCIQTNHPFANWDINNCITISKEKKLWISNEVFVIYKDEVILSHKKAVFFKEVTSKILLNKFNYDFGFGINNFITQNNDYINLAKLINKYISIQICKECQDELLFLRKYFIKFDENLLSGENKEFFTQKKNYLNN